MAFDLSGHVALITGSSTGLGKGMAFVLGKAGAKVAINYLHNEERASRTFAEFKEAGCEGMLIQGDAQDWDDVHRMVAEIENELGTVDILIPNATPDQPHRPIEDYDLEFYQSMYDFFIKSPFILARAVLPKMKEKKWGRIINIGSEVYQASVENFSPYVAAKGGQTGWTRSMARELAPFGITVNIIAPGWIPTERHEKDPQEEKDGYLASIPMGRWGTPEDVGHAALYFASREAGFISGQTLCVNGANTPW